MNLLYVESKVSLLLILRIDAFDSTYSAYGSIQETDYIRNIVVYHGLTANDYRTIGRRQNADTALTSAVDFYSDMQNWRKEYIALGSKYNLNLDNYYNILQKNIIN